MGTADVFREFLQRHGAVVHADLQLLVPMMGDRGVIAAKNISAGQQLMLIPTSICPHMPGEQVRTGGLGMPHLKHRLSYWHGLLQEWSSLEPHHFSPAVQYLKQSCPQEWGFLASHELIMVHEQAAGTSSMWSCLETLRSVQASWATVHAHRLCTSWASSEAQSLADLWADLQALQGVR